MTPDMLDFLRALVYVVHPEDFKTLKRDFGRPLDLRDLEGL
ncbi:MAG: hypothetical protein ACK4ZX_04450 [Thermus sp.]